MASGEAVLVADELKRVNLGCGSQTPERWINVDYSIGAKFAKIPAFAAVNRRLKLFKIDWRPDIVIHDLRRPFPWRDGELDAIYTSHTLQHFGREEGLAFLRECARVLKSGGIIRVVVPDLRRLVDDYLSGETRADHFIERLRVHHYSERRGPLAKLAPLIQYPCKCMYDEAVLIAAVQSVGFTGETRQPFCSRLADIEAIELPNRTERGLIVEGVKT